MYNANNHIYLSKIKQKKNHLKNIKFSNINMDTILDITPNDIFSCWNDNKNKITFELRELKSEIMKSAKEFNATDNYSAKVQLKQEIQEMKYLMDALNSTFKKWVTSLYKDIKNSVRHLIRELLPKAAAEDLDILTSQFGNILSQQKYLNMPLREIIHIFVRNYTKRNRKVSHINYDFNSNEIVNDNNFIINGKSAANTKENLIKVEEILPSNKQNISTQHTSEIIHSKNLHSYSNKGSTNNAKVHMFYGSFDIPFDDDNMNLDSLELMLLNSLGLMSKFLYGTIQKQLAKLYKELDEKNNNKS